MANWKEKGNYLCKSFDFEDYSKTILFASRVFRLCDKLNHHADILVKYNKVQIRTTTHDQNKITQKDHELSKGIDLIEKEGTLK